MALPSYHRMRAAFAFSVLNEADCREEPIGSRWEGTGKDCHVRIVVAGLRRTFHARPGMRFFSKRQATARSSHRVGLSRLGGQRLVPARRDC
jgi:hypothetical protein